MKNNLTAFIAFLCLLITSCNENGFGKKQFQFYYYPSKNVYYDVAGKQYAYSINGGKTWNLFTSKSNIEPATLGSKQIIYSDLQQPWNLNEVHRKKYNGALLSVADVDTASRQTGIVSDKKIAVKKPKLNVDETPKQEEKKPGFFKRLFGGKKRNNNQ